MGQDELLRAGNVDVGYYLGHLSDERCDIVEEFSVLPRPDDRGDLPKVSHQPRAGDGSMRARSMPNSDAECQAKASRM
jgi:hypothetical protein